MSDYAVIVENDASVWDDVTGDLYHYPRKYSSILTPGCRVIYYKGGVKDKSFAPERLSPDPHYFGAGVVGNSIPDPESSKGDRYCEILDYQEFSRAVLAKMGGSFLEVIPESRATNFWRDGVREATEEVFNTVLDRATLSERKWRLPSLGRDFESQAITEGHKKERYSSYYERSPFCRARAIQIHGLTCIACGINFGERYGEWGAGFIHVHHNKPVSETGPTTVDPATDMSVLCPNCHSMIHRKKNQTLSISQLKALLRTDT